MIFGDKLGLTRLVRLFVVRLYFLHTQWSHLMLHFENAPKKATNLSLNVKILEAARIESEYFPNRRCSVG